MYAIRSYYDIAYAVAFAAHQEFFKSLAECTQVHVKDCRIDLRVIVFQVLGGFDRVHTADIGAIWVTRAIPIGIA